MLVLEMLVMVAVLMHDQDHGTLHREDQQVPAQLVAVEVERLVVLPQMKRWDTESLVVLVMLLVD